MRDRTLLVEDRDLYKGIFWIIDLDDIDNNDLYFQIPITSDGTIINDSGLCLNSKNSNNYNHKLTWNELSNRDTHNKSFDYYPRGRVEVNNGRANIYLNPNIAVDEVIDWIIDKFNLTEYNGIKKITIHPDYSEHYKCYLD